MSKVVKSLWPLSLSTQIELWGLIVFGVGGVYAVWLAKALGYLPR